MALGGLNGNDMTLKIFCKNIPCTLVSVCNVPCRFSVGIFSIAFTKYGAGGGGWRGMMMTLKIQLVTSKMVTAACVLHKLSTV